MKILLIGQGYVGTTMAVVLANAGHEVTGLDIDHDKIASLQKGKLYFYEPGVQKMLDKQLEANRLQFTTDARQAVVNNDILFITVGTPSLSNGNADLTYIKNAAKMIGQYKNKKKIIVVKSTVPVGTTEKVKDWVMEAGEDTAPVEVAMNPEFLREGNALQDALYPDRIVIGSHSDEALETIHQLYQQWNCPFIKTTPRGAEMIKYASNGFLATKISFINEIAMLCDKLEVNVRDVSKGMGLDKRIGPSFLEAGLGYGGSCFPKDIKEFLWTANTNQIPLSILSKVEQVNHHQPDYLLDKVKKQVGSLTGKNVAVLGLAFKPHTDDTRESVSIPIIQQLLEEKAIVTVHDPVVNLEANWIEKGVLQNNDPYQVIKESDAIIICTNWPQYEALDWKKVRKIVRHPAIFDGRNMLNAEQLSELRFHYEGIGYP
ncbi:UDP-glucose 6-dehydrogenase [Thalassobacillus devorans]|uniref:UDP-glucose 6-dehydrogenase n=1 Tax=Thalassobacillus devorans TaxID=279813 RepID=A0ABQ1P0J6_9BACI|nr:UDP-glucose/GDP-mannose dehydrogenase family protein [Thalassobacillus devorans]NIK28144.1 UDPglucose 6-dehydrogenase [Thalassobacillus devorans]GGC88542.1 UDP-glucose 6-dehydrogenase [Thalassobacillus devorans]